ncbi:MAG: hypothetical protein A2Y62_01630 [Candidatus Fischerbacteria bacterium RBG_13_37_8]|uniref:Glycosyl transferase family 1 domain-containing protein n=1 Tax=Candidatus Fischerbacteria bacterium RBG_13_37_8 TaxID=1817863 RepID=A0A1F5V7S8_9BACT|nr:MAG: hypothetical protein A2Y62_01630 [Candidatus Fischerbacteria bacterium RBG_13_37_8]
MKLVLLRNYKEEQQLSMKAYADCISAKLREKCKEWDIIDYHPKNLKFDTITNTLPIARKAMDLFNRYVYYPSQVRKIQADIYHIVDHANSLFIKNLDEKKVIVTCHDLIPLLIEGGYFKNIKKPPLALKIFKSSMNYIKKATLIFADSENTMKDLYTVAGVQRCRIVKMPLAAFYPFKRTMEEQNNLFRKKLNVADDTYIILTVGLNIFYKNVKGILETLSSLPEKINGKKWIFYHLGERYTEKDLQVVKNEQVRDRIKQLGALSYPELELFYNSADVLFFPSLYEGFGMPVLEAMQCSLPVITSKVASIPEIGNEAVAYVDPNNTEEMQQMICEVLSNNKLRQSLQEKGLKQAQLFNWDNIVNKMIPYYNSILQ